MDGEPKTFEYSGKIVAVMPVMEAYAADAVAEATKQFKHDLAEMAADNIRLRAENKPLVEALKEAQFTIHCGQYHQWKNVDDCTDKTCVKYREIIAAARRER
jgi:endonuclease I